MGKVLIVISVFILSLGSGCRRSEHVVHSNASPNKSFPYNPYWDYTGYSPHQSQEYYNRYQPERSDDIVKNLKEYSRDRSGN